LPNQVYMITIRAT